MKNKFFFVFNSLKQSIVNKPIAIVLLFLVIFVNTVCCCIPSRHATESIKEKYSKDANMFFSMEENKFKDNLITLGDYLVKKDEEIISNGKMGCSISIEQYDCNITIKGNEFKIDQLPVTFDILALKDIYIDKKNVCEIGEQIAMAYGIVEGDTINIYETDFVVKKIIPSENNIYLPYNIKINKWYTFSSSPDPFSGKPNKARINGYIYGISHKDMSVVHKQLKKFGCKRDNTDLAPITNSFVLVFMMLLIGMFISSTILWYWLKCNNKKYATYKTIGCSPTMLACAMIVEVLIVAIVAIGFGLLVDFILSIIMHDIIFITGFEWLHYLLLIGGPLISMMIVTFIAVCKRAVAMPANTKHNG